MRIFLWVALFCISACSFSPLYQKDVDSGILDQTAHIRVNPIPNAIGYLVKEQLETKLKTENTSDKTYALTVTVKEDVVGDLGIEKTNFATRSRMTLTANYNLKEIKTNSVLIDDKAKVQTSYNLTNPYSTLVAEDKVRRDLSRALADNISLRVLAYFKQDGVIKAQEKTDHK